MRRAFVHVGMPRTGSTTFQHIMFHHRAALAGAGVLYPDLTPRSAAAAPHINHQHLGEALDGRRPQREAVELLGRLDEGLRRTDADVVLLSYEGFIQQKLAPRISQRLRAVFDRHGFRMEAAAAVKPQAEMLNSLYAHRLQLMLEKRLFAGFAAAMEGSARFDYHRLVLPWLHACDGRVHAVPLRAADDPAPLVERLLRALGLQGRIAPILAAGEARRVENRSPGPVAAEVSRRLRLLRAHTRLRVSPREMMRAVEGAAQERGLDRMGFRGVDPALRDRMAARHHDGNARFAAAVWGRDWSAVVAPEPETAVNEVARLPLDPAMGGHVEAILHEACAQPGAATAPISADSRPRVASRKGGMGHLRCGCPLGPFRSRPASVAPTSCQLPFALAASVSASRRRGIEGPQAQPLPRLDRYDASAARRDGRAGMKRLERHW